MNPQIWILAAGRLLSQVGTGFTMFYAAIFFVNQVGVSATAVGIALSSQSISGVLGRFWGGVGADSPRWGRKRILVLSAIFSALADGVLAAADNLPLLLMGNLLMGWGAGLYWPATEAIVADLTQDQQRNEAFALTRIADMVGLSLGIALAGQWIVWNGNYRWLFVMDGVSFVIFGGLIILAIQETLPRDRPAQNIGSQWRRARQDQTLMFYCVVNVLFTGAIAQVQSTVPLYFTTFVTAGSITPIVLSHLATFYIVLSALLQWPIVRWLNRFSRWQTLMLSMLVWSLSFAGVWLTGISSSGAIALAVLSFSLFALASVTYTPAASALVAELAPEDLRGMYLALNSQCWAAGYFLGPLLGGWAMDQSLKIVHGVWLGGAGLMLVGWVALAQIARREHQMQQKMSVMVHQAAQACQHQDAAGFAALFTPDGEIQLPQQTIQGQAAIAQVTQAYLASCEAIAIEIQQVKTVGRDRLQVQWQWSEPHKQRLNQLEIYFQQGKIQRWQEF
ncbi:MAG: MFS transporter [Spirulina sp. SIO3F2]|nr:MFS transporter [Spirulina sp. SIO3F2]